MRIRIVSLAVSLVSLLAACSGGGSNNDAAPQPSPESPSLPPVANPLQPLNVTVPVTAWMGKNESSMRVVFPPELGAATLYSYSNSECDVTASNTCQNLTSNVITPDTDIDSSSFNLSKTSYYELRTPSRYSEKINIGGDELPYLINHQVVSFKGKLWVFGGNARGLKTDVYSTGSGIWSSDDGKVWHEHVSDAVFNGLEYHQVVEYNDQLILSGGKKDGNISNEIKVSDDGVNWKSASYSGFPSITHHQMIVFDGALYVLGGKEYGSVTTAKMWKLNTQKSAWEPVETATAVKPPAHHSAQVAVFKATDESKAKLWLIGGATSSGGSVDKVYAFDGNNWQMVEPNDAFEACKNHSLHASEGALWIVGCVSKNTRKPTKLFKSLNGKDWTSMPIETSHWLYKRNQLRIADHQGALFAVGGANRNRGLLYEDEVWSAPRFTDAGSVMSNKGLWNDVPIMEPVRAVSHKGEIWVAGVDTQRQIRLYRSQNGSDWTPQSLPINGVQKLAQMVSFNGRLMLFDKNIIHYTENGVDWQQVSMRADGLTDVYGRGQYSLTKFEQGGTPYLYLVGGGRPLGAFVSNDTAQYGSEVWRTQNGLKWEKVTSTSGFNLKNHTSFALNGQLWVVGGMDGRNRQNTVWVSSNGKDWNNQGALLDMEPRWHLRSVVRGGKAYVFGGQDRTNSLKGYLFSTDGSTWVKSDVPKGVALAVQQSGVALLNGMIYIIGGRDVTMQTNNHIWRIDGDANVQRLYKTEIPKKTGVTP